MPSYFITGAARGLGFAFLDHLSKDASNTVVGLVRNKADTEAKTSEWKRPNVYIIQGDITDYEALKHAVHATAEITGGTLDYLIANAAYLPLWSAFDPLSVLGADPEKLETELLTSFKTNVIANIHLFNLAMPLIQKGNVKKIITISSGMADMELVRNYDVVEGGPYSIGKAAMNMAVAKFGAEYAKDGVLFMSVCPGVVDTGLYNDLTEKQQQQLAVQGAKFQRYAPHFAGPATPEDAVKDVLSVIEKASLANGDSGNFISHLGTKQWL
ncbi:hypothetical protein NX059_006251 [Plenodomus lindquistii]|nr:hypothetical protein NX059_006251 [Plenodomus lindquistii]